MLFQIDQKLTELLRNIGAPVHGIRCRFYDVDGAEIHMEHDDDHDLGAAGRPAAGSMGEPASGGGGVGKPASDDSGGGEPASGSSGEPAPWPRLY